jgi:hypothetical protein
VICIREVSGSDLARGIYYTRYGYVWFSSFSPGENWDSTLKHGKATSLQILSNLSFINHSVIRRCRV